MPCSQGSKKQDDEKNLGKDVCVHVHVRGIQDPEKMVKVFSWLVVWFVVFVLHF